MLSSCDLLDCRLQTDPVRIRPDWLRSITLDDHIVVVSYCNTVVLNIILSYLISYCRTIILSYSHTILLWYYHVIISSYEHTMILSHYHTVVLACHQTKPETDQVQKFVMGARPNRDQDQRQTDPRLQTRRSDRTGPAWTPNPTERTNIA